MRPPFLRRVRGFAPRSVEQHTDLVWGAALFLLALLLFGLHLGNLPLRDWDEGTVAQVAREIWRDPQTWLHPTLHGQPYLNKPPLMHGFIALSYALFGSANEWTARLPGALLSATSVLTVYAIGRELWRRRATAVWSALVYLTWLPVVRHGRLAMLDGAILAFWTLWLLCLLRSRRDLRYSLGVGLAVTLVGLTKGIFLAVLFGAISTGFLLWDTPRLLTNAWFWGGVSLGSLPLLTWYGLQWQFYGGEFLREHLLNQSASRVWDSVEQNGGPPWYYVLELIKYGFPWSIFVPMALKLAWGDRCTSWAKLLLVWSGGYFLAVSVMGTKLPWYVLPVYPALALAVGVILDGIWRESAVTGMPDTPAQPYPQAWLVIFAVLAAVAWLGSIWMMQQLLLGVETVDANLVVTLLTAAMTLTLTVWLGIQCDRQMVLVLVWGWCLSLLLFVSSSHWLWELNEDYPVKPVATMIQQGTSAQPIYTSHPYDRPSLNFYADRPIYSASLSQLKQRWQTQRNPCLLLDRDALEALALSRPHFLGWEEGWHLVCRTDAIPMARSPQQEDFPE